MVQRLLVTSKSSERQHCDNEADVGKFRVTDSVTSANGERGIMPVTNVTTLTVKPGGWDEMRENTKKAKAILEKHGRNSQELWIGSVDHAAASVWFSTITPFSNVAPARTRATRCGPLTARQRSWAASISLNAMASPAAREPGPLVTLVRSRTVENVDSIGFVVLRWIQCSAGKS